MAQGRRALACSLSESSRSIGRTCRCEPTGSRRMGRSAAGDPYRTAGRCNWRWSRTPDSIMSLTLPCEAGVHLRTFCRQVSCSEDCPAHARGSSFHPSRLPTNTESTPMRFVFPAALVLSSVLLSSPMVVASAQSSSARKGAASRQQVSASYGRLPLSFTANQGQADRRTGLPWRRGGGYSIALERATA